jgi:primosomal protein N' (replication factor Y)
VITADVEAAAKWAQRLAKLDRVVRLDSGVSDDERMAAWRALRDGSVRLAAGTRSALLAALPPPATLALLDEHEAAHKPPGPPRMHSRDVALERAARESLALVMTSATPSVEAWWRAESGLLDMPAREPGPWPAVSIADTRGILRREPLTPPLARAIRETLAARRRVFLVISRLTSSLACDECGTVVRCGACAIAFAYSRAAARLVCRLCGASQPLPETCAACQGRRLTPFGWGAERVEHAVRRRFPDVRIARWDAEASRGARGEAQRAAAAAADVVIGTRGALRLFGPAALGLAAFVAPDQLLRAPDFRAAERTLALAWAAAERVAPDGALIIQSQNPGHYAFEAVARQNLTEFYRQELKFRGELGYPPFRRLAVVTVRAADSTETRRLADAVGAALRGARDLTVYPPVADRSERVRRIVAKGGADMPRRLDEALSEFKAPTAGRGMIDVEVDPVEWPF